MAYAVEGGHRYISINGHNIHQDSKNRNISRESPDIALCTLCAYLFPFVSLSAPSEVRQEE
jgi:hypothetical protein